MKETEKINGKENRYRKLVVYQDKKTGSIFLRPTLWEEGTYKLKHASLGGMLLKFGAFDSLLGKVVKEYLKQCD